MLQGRKFRSDTIRNKMVKSEEAKKELGISVDMRINTKGVGRQEAADVMHCRRTRTCLTLAGAASGSWEQFGQSSRNEISLKRLLSCMAHIWCGRWLRQLGTGH